MAYVKLGGGRGVVAGSGSLPDSKGMRIGVFLLAARFPGQGDEQVLAATVEAAVAAERAGFDEVWLAEHHFMSYGICPSAVTLAAYVLGATRRVAVGTAVSVLSTAHPVALAEQAALLDQVSAGRFRLGVGRGGPWRELEVFGTGLARYESGFAEGLDVLLAAPDPRAGRGGRRVLLLRAGAGGAPSADPAAPAGGGGRHLGGHRGTGGGPGPADAAGHARR